MAGSGQAAVDALAGIGGGVVALISTYPLMTITTRLQTARSAASKSSKSQQPSEDSSQQQQQLLPLSLKSLISLYSGLRPAIFGTICSQGTYYFFYSLLRRAVSGGSERHATLSISESIFVSSLAGCINVLLTNPIWVVVTRMQHANKPFVQTVYELYREGGSLNAWSKGVLPSLFMVSNPVVQFALLESLSNLLRSRGIKRSTVNMLLIGALAKLFATVLTYPLLVVKSVLQVSGPSNMLRALISLYERHGVWAFFRGIETKIAQSVLAAAILYAVRSRLQAFVRRVVLFLIKKQAALK
eukprot:CAMPEP_0182445996 /NCGR_PEP_ID=MMETSP1172-20130603/3917_1 /TAXON_ID=708627 /ORGANISM="Timspurckia oligopyrenoides, Strain CCMP3278" /LENGTH=299 /DNA_ID=CAMNT_0024641851 /DNA_START=153 /DNA_END=1052 /DNA_ORIENTATION=+